MNPIASFLVALCVISGIACGYWLSPFAPVPFILLAALIAMSLKMANAWEKFVVLRLGKLQGVKGAGLFFIVPVIDSVIAVIDGRIQTTAFNAEQALTRDTVPVNVDAIIFWHVEDAEKAALAITNYREAIDRVACVDDQVVDGPGLVIEDEVGDVADAAVAGMDGVALDVRRAAQGTIDGGSPGGACGLVDGQLCGGRHLETLWSKNITITTRLVDTVTIPMLLKTVRAARIDASKLITHRFKFDKILDAYEAFGHAADTKALKVIIEA